MDSNRCFRSLIPLGLVVAMLAGGGLLAQSIHEAPTDAPSQGRVAPAGEPGERLTVTGVVVDAAGKPIGGACIRPIAKAITASSRRATIAIRG